MSERLLDVENEAMLKIVELEKQLMQTNKELDHIRVRNQMNFFKNYSRHGDNKREKNRSLPGSCCVQEVYASANSQVHTLRRMVREKDQTIRRQSHLERQAQEPQQAGGPGALQPQRGEGDGGVADSVPPSPPPCSSISLR